MKTIWKFPLNLSQNHDFEMPKGAIILCVLTQHNNPYLWAIVDDDSPTEKRNVVVYGSGEPMPNDPGNYIGTFLLIEETLVSHVFEVPKK